MTNKNLKRIRHIGGFFIGLGLAFIIQNIFYLLHISEIWFDITGALLALIFIYGIKQIKLTCNTAYPNAYKILWGSMLLYFAITAYLADGIDFILLRIGSVIIDVGLIICLATKAFNPSPSEASNQ